LPIQKRPESASSIDNASIPDSIDEKVQEKILVIGALGLLGRALMEELVRMEFAVTAVSHETHENLGAPVKNLLKDLDVDYVKLDPTGLNNNSLLASVVQGFDLVVNLDQAVVTWDGVEEVRNHSFYNVDLPVQLGDLAQEYSIPLFCISTDCVWSGTKNGANGYPPVEVDTDIRFAGDKSSSYGSQKKSMEKKLAGNTWVTVLRIPILYGRMLHPLEDGTASNSISNYLGENDWSYGTSQQRYLTDADDVAFILSALIQKRLESGLGSCVYHYGAQKSISKYQFMELFKMAARLPLEISVCDTEEQSVNQKCSQDFKLCIEKTRSELSEYGSWREPKNLDIAAVKKVWVPHFQESIAQKSQSADKLISVLTDTLNTNFVQPAGRTPRTWPELRADLQTLEQVLASVQKIRMNQAKQIRLLAGPMMGY